MTNNEVIHSGVVFVDKPLEWSSHDAVARMRRILKTRKIGHAGTLDPLATGLLTLGVGQSTRLLTHMVGLDKTYQTTILLGKSTVSDDSAGETTATASKNALQDVTNNKILETVRSLTGAIEQIPSRVSAIKVDGKRAYNLVRDGEEVELKARPVTVHSFDIDKISRDETTGMISVFARVHCSAGTYVRALARDLGEALGVGGHLKSLRRTAVGPFQLPDHPGTNNPVVATTAGDLTADSPLVKTVEPATIARKLFPVLELKEEQARDLLHGKRFAVGFPDTKLVAAIDAANHLVGLAEVKEGRIRAVTNFSRD